MKRIANLISTTELCSYGCGNVAQYINGSKKLMCCKSSNSCPENKRKNSSKGKEAYTSGKRLPAAELYKTLPQESKDKMNWAKGLTKEIDARVARPEFIGRKWGTSLTGHTEKSKAKISKARTEFLKKAENRKNLGRHKRSWMEVTFEAYLNSNNIIGWDTEVHFWNEELRKNYYPDFIFESKKLIIELDGTQHRKTVEKDKIRDLWFNNKGYTVIRITHAEFKERYFSGRGFMDLLRM